MPEWIHYPPYNAAPYIEVTLESGREIWATAYTAEMTYSELLVGVPTREMNARRLRYVPERMKRRFDAGRVHTIKPEVQTKIYGTGHGTEITESLPPYQFGAEFMSTPIEEQMHASWLIIVWYQHEPLPALSEANRKQVEKLSWAKLAEDFEY